MFAAVDHFDACCVDIHAVKTGNRFAALQPIAQGLQMGFGATGADVGRGLALRIDNGTQYTADDFLNQTKFWGVAPSFAFVAEPQTNGVAERFNRTPIRRPESRTKSNRRKMNCAPTLQQRAPPSSCRP